MVEFYPFGECSHHYPLLSYLGERTGLCKPHNEISAMTIAIAAIAAIALGGTLTKVTLQRVGRKLTTFISQGEIHFSMRLIPLPSIPTRTFSDTSNAPYLELELNNSNPNSEEFILLRPSLTSEEQFITACNKGDVSFLAHYYQNKPSPEKLLFIELIRFSKLETLQDLMKFCPDLLSFKDGEGHFLIHYAAMSNKPEWVKRILQIEPGLRLQKTNDDELPLHLAAQGGFKEVAKVLLEENVSEQLLTSDGVGKTPLDIATQFQKKDIICFFENY